jgi:hypothetical protein
MPRLCYFEGRNEQGMYVNPLLVRGLTWSANLKRTVVHFDIDHHLNINLPVDEVAAALDKAMNESG